MNQLYTTLVAAIKEHAELDDAEIIEASRYGADAGWNGFIYTSDTTKFFDAHANLIWSLLIEDAASLGESHPLAFMATLGRKDMAETWDGFRNLLAWYALERAGWYLEALKEEQDSS